MRRQVIQQLLVGDLADLADEGLYQLLPSGLEKARAGKKWKEFKNQHSGAMANPKRKKGQTNHSLEKSGLTKDTMCYVSLEQRVLHQLRQSHTESQLVQALRDATFPELNLRSYLDCRSDLALPTIRHILRGRPTDEALELDRSLTRATMGHKQNMAPSKHGSLAPAAPPRKPQSQAHLHPWLMPMEFED